MSFLSNLFGGNRTVTQATSSAPWKPQQPYLQQIFGEAQRLYEDEGPEYFPGTSVVPFSPQTEQALGMTEQMALQGSPLEQAGMDAMLATARGDFLPGSEGFEQAFSGQVAPLVQRYSEELLPGLQSSFTAGGFRGGSGEQQAAMSMMDSFNRALSGTAGQLYGQERGRQMQAAGMAPQYAMTRFQNPQMLANVGAAREGLAQAQLSDEIARHNFEQNIQADKLAQYLGIVGGGFGSEGTSSQPIYRNVGANILGGGMAGAGLGQALGLGAGGTAATAGLGGLLSLF